MLYDLLADSARQRPAKLAIVEARRSYTYGDLMELIAGWERRLRGVGAGPSDVVAIQLPNSAQWVAAFYAADKVGAVILPLDPSLKRSETERYCAQAGVKVMVFQPEPGASAGESAQPQALRMGAQTGASPPSAALSGQQGGVLFLSSGTTGMPKLVFKTAAQSTAHVELSQQVTPRAESDVVLAVLPFFHTVGLSRVLAATLSQGATLVIDSFSPRSTAETIRRERVSVFIGSPLMVRLLAETDFRQLPDFSSLKVMACGGASLQPAVAQAFEDKFGLLVQSFYGSTESGPISECRPSQRPDQPGWIGKPYPSITVEIWDSEGKPVPPGVPGRVAVKSAAASSMYLGDPEATARTFQRGYALPGDIGYLDEAGELYLVERERPMINVAGEKVSPSEVEACLLSHPAVREALVVADRSEAGTERVKALVVPRAAVTPDELREFCQQRLADFKVPRQIALLDEIPRGPLGKPRVTSV